MDLTNDDISARCLQPSSTLQDLESRWSIEWASAKIASIVSNGLAASCRAATDEGEFAAFFPCFMRLVGVAGLLLVARALLGVARFTIIDVMDASEKKN